MNLNFVKFRELVDLEFGVESELELVGWHTCQILACGLHLLSNRSAIGICVLWILDLIVELSIELIL